MVSRIAIIDDDESFARILEKRVINCLEDAQFTKFNSLGGFKEFRNANPLAVFDLIIIDEHLPDGRGSDFIKDNNLYQQPVLSVSSDLSQDMPARSLKAGAHYFLSKSKVSEDLFQPLVLALIERFRMQQELADAKLEAALADNIRTLVKTLKHELNNPLGTLMGACFVLKRGAKDPADQHTSELIEQSAKRIQHVLEQFTEALKLEVVSKAEHQVFQVPGDKKWEG
jgi:response regulator of citrate/malate metabolism